MADDYNKGPRSWCEKNYDSDPEYCDAVLGGKTEKKACGGKVHGKKKMKSGGKVCRGGRSAVRGTKFSGVK
jgi:hypothetical protein